MKTKNWEFFCARTANNRLLRFTNQDQAVINLLLRGLQILGYADGKNVAIEYRDAEGNYERFSKEVNELVRLNPDVIFSFGGEQAPVVKAATSSIPIVVVVGVILSLAALWQAWPGPAATSQASHMSMTCSLENQLSY